MKVLDSKLRPSAGFQEDGIPFLFLSVHDEEFAFTQIGLAFSLRIFIIDQIVPTIILAEVF
jgi:hypothetical protein